MTGEKGKLAGKERLRIAHVLRRLSFDDWGGTEQVVWNLAKAQLAEGHDVRIFATTALSPVRYECREGLEIYRFPPVYPWWPMSKSLIATLDLKGGNPFVPGLANAIEEWRPDVIHCHAMARIAELCIRTGEKTGAKCVISLHGGGANVPVAEAQSLVAPTRGLAPWGKMIDILLHHVRRIPEDADGIVCVGEDEYLKYKEKHGSAMFLPNGVDCSIFAAAGAKKREGRFNVLCVARIDRQKNQLMLVEALARHPEMKLRLVGPVTQQDYKAELERRAKELGVDDRLSIVPPLKPGSAELVNEYSSADIFALASRHEPFGIVVLEAWAAGLPVVASNVGGLGRLCAAHPGAAEVFSPEDSSSLDAALAKARKEPETLSCAGIKAAREYDWRVLCKKTVDFYRQI